MKIETGNRFRSTIDTAEVVVLKPPNQEVELTCGGAAINVLENQAHLMGLGRAKAFVLNASQSGLLFRAETLGVLAP